MMGLWFAAAALAAAPITLWQNVTVGMTIDELRSAQPSAAEIPPEKRSTYLSECTYTGGKVMIATAEYDVCFAITDGKVQEVILYTSHGNVDDDHISYIMIKATLARKYGKPILNECDAIKSGSICNSIWKARGITISAMNTSTAGISSVAVTYSTEAASKDPV